MSIGYNLASGICGAFVAASVGLTAQQIDDILYPALRKLTDDLKLGDWIELPNGTTAVVTFTPKGVPCETCDGTGEVHSHNSICWGCRGSGKQSDLEKEPRFYVHDSGHIDDENRADYRTWADDPELAGIVDTEAGGIIAYALQENAEMLECLLRVATTKMEVTK